MQNNTLTIIRAFSTSLSCSARNKHKVYVEYGPKHLLTRPSRAKSRQMKQLLPPKLRVTGRYVNEHVIGGNRQLPGRVAIHGL